LVGASGNVRGQTERAFPKDERNFRRDGTATQPNASIEPKATDRQAGSADSAQGSGSPGERPMIQGGVCGRAVLDAAGRVGDITEVNRDKEAK